MRHIPKNDSWPPSWLLTYTYDEMEIYGCLDCRGYSYAYDTRRARTFELVRRVAPPGARVLDVAAAQGNFSLALAEEGYDVTWNDLRADLMEYVKLKHERGRIAFAPGNVFELGLGPEFDVILATEVIEHVAHPDRFLAQLSGLLKPGGHLVLTTPNGGYFLNRLPKFSECRNPSVYEAVQFQPNSDGHIFLIHVDEIAGLAAKAGLEVQQVRIYTNFLTNGHIKTESLLRVLPKRWVEKLESLSVRMPWPLRNRLHAGMAVLFRRQG